MKRCKCISTKFFEEIKGEDYGISIGDIRYYDIGDIFDSGDYAMQALFEIKHDNKTVVYMLEREFKKTFIDLNEYRNQIIKKLLISE